MLLKKTLSLFLILVLTLSGLTACRKKEPAEPKSDYTGIELTYYKVFDGSDVIDPLIHEYEAQHPGLKIRYKMFTDFDEYQKTILNEMAEGEGPDIFSMQNTWFVPNYRKLTPMPEDKGTPKDFAKIFVDIAYQDLVRADDDGDLQVYGLPMTVDTLALYYNKDHFEDRIPSRGAPANTWEGIKQDVVLLNKLDESLSSFEVAGIAMGRGDNISRAVDTLYLLFLQYGVHFYNDVMSKATFAGQRGAGLTVYPALEALKLMVGFSDEKNRHYSWNEFMADDDSDGKEVAAFAAGKVSMILGYSYTYDEILRQIDLLKSEGVPVINKNAIEVTEIPQLYDPKVSTEKRVTYGSYFAETVSKNSEHSDIAWDFLIFLTEKDNLDYYFDELHKPTSRRDMIEDQRKDPIYGPFAAQIGYAESFPIVDYYRYKEIFADLINRADTDSIDRSGLVTAQDLISGMLPKDGYITEVKENNDEDTQDTVEDTEEN